MSKTRDISIEDLREMMVSALRISGYSESYIDGFIAAQELSGWLRPRTPAWVRNSAAVHYALPHAKTR